MVTTIAYPKDETFIAEGYVTDWTPSGGGPSFAPTFTTITVDEQSITIRNADNHITCGACWMDSDRRRGTGSYGKGYFVLVTQVHGHYMVRTK